ncbi:origin recognition complex subunit 3 ASCRUDRAFT_9750 [Ascoidea rubescens DSM 1968]|uniref:Uncharacterized protein n=1 Tax=Ascoidea rubescens DSM 1968 TaxID=1344418 RepID=A0A1D2VBK8_9ASCO|nr:hypothetical protein ASCRUDRAFT_9750 [Ascoidea rubescens DSM 1968]ODV58990.1 hypothetical protein ASCRUDRAFT_9750 [Ascoidea rubescens DSM 1968]
MSDADSPFFTINPNNNIKKLIYPLNYQNQILFSNDHRYFLPLPQEFDSIDFTDLRQSNFTVCWQIFDQKLSDLLTDHNNSLFVRIKAHLFKNLEYKTNSKLNTLLILNGNSNTNLFPDLQDFIDNLNNNSISNTEKNANYIFDLIEIDSSLTYNIKLLLNHIILNLINKNDKLFESVRNKFDNNTEKYINADTDYDALEDEFKDKDFNFDYNSDFEFDYDFLSTISSTLYYKRNRKLILYFNDSQNLDQSTLLVFFNFINNSSFLKNYIEIFINISTSLSIFNSFISSSILSLLDFSFLKLSQNSNSLIENILSSLLLNPIITHDIIEFNKSKKITKKELYSANLTKGNPISNLNFLLFGPYLMNLLKDRHNNSLISINSFVSTIKYSILCYFYNNPLSIFFNSHDLNLNENHLITLKNLLSFKSFINNILKNQLFFKDKKKLHNLIEKNLEVPQTNKNTKKLSANQLYFKNYFVPFALAKFKINMINFLDTLDILVLTQKIIIANSTFKEQTNQRIIDYISQNSLADSPIKKNVSNYRISSAQKSPKHFTFLSKTDLYSKILTGTLLKTDFLDQLISNLKHLLPHFLTKLFKLLKSYNTNSLNKKSLYFKDITEFKFEDNYILNLFYKKLKTEIGNDIKNFDVNGIYFYPINICNNPDNNNDENLNDGLENLPIQGKFAFSTIIHNLVECFDKFLLDPFYLVKSEVELDDNQVLFLENIIGSNYLSNFYDDLLFNEVFTIKDHKIVESSIFPPARNFIEDALINPKSYLFNSKAAVPNKTDLLEDKNDFLYEVSSEEEQDLEIFQDITRKRKSSDARRSLKNSIDKQINPLKQLSKISDPLISEMYRLYIEAPININVYDFYQAFKSTLSQPKYLANISNALDQPEISNIILDETIVKDLRVYLDINNNTKLVDKTNDETNVDNDLKWEKITLAWFLQVLEEIKNTGLIGTNRKNVEIVKKLVWKGL